MTGFILGTLLLSATSTTNVGSISGGGVFIEVFRDKKCKTSVMISTNVIQAIEGGEGITVVHSVGLNSTYICIPYQTLLIKAKEEMNKQEKK